ncbi:MAG TPA: LamG-like jellyroll fold domain-containing protein [Armatimonadota bacterium]|nr:LamG-like jellyroll fold domain-containing protein [Armatimonadota bacterium]
MWTSIDVPAKVKQCPTAGKTVANAYVYSNFLSGISIGEVFDPISELLTADGQGDAGTNPTTYANVAYSDKNFALRHQNKLVVSFADGHVETRTEATWKYTAVYWFDASAINPGDLTQVDSLGRVLKWKDSSGHGYDATQVNDSQKPLYNAQLLNNRPALRMGDTSGTWRIVKNSYNKAVRTVFAAGCTTFTSGVPTYEGIQGVGITDGGSCNHTFELQMNNWPANPQGHASFIVGYTDGTETSINGTHGYNTNQPFVVGGKVDTEKNRICLYENGRMVNSTALSTTKTLCGFAPPVSAGGTVGCGRSAGGGTDPFKGYIGEVVVFDHTLSDSDCQSIGRYLQLKYAAEN